MAQQHQHEPLQRDPALRRLLADSASPEVLPWSSVLRIVDSAPPARRAWYAGLLAPLQGGTASLRYAAASVATLIVATGVLAVVPAQSDHAGTIVSTQLPTSWSVDGPELTEVRHAAQAEYAQSVGDTGQMYFISTERAGRPELTLALEHVNETAADELLSSLTARYPALGAFPAELSPIATERQSVLGSMFERMLGGDDLAGMDANAARIRILQTLSKLGLKPTAVSSRQDAAGNLIISVDAELEIQVEGRTQEALKSAGLGPELLGTELDELEPR